MSFDWSKAHRNYTRPATTEKDRVRNRNNQRRKKHTNRIKSMLQKFVCIFHYSHGSMSCACCKESNYGFLTIDHENGDGAKHRKEIGMITIYSWLVGHNFPEGFRVYCMNCNWGSRIDGICPHKNTTYI